MLKPANMSDMDIIKSIRKKASSPKIDENTNRTMEVKTTVSHHGDFNKESWQPDRSVPKEEIYKEYDPYAHLRKDGASRSLLGADSISKTFKKNVKESPRNNKDLLDD